MQKTSEYIELFYWVYILQNRKTREYKIGYTINAPDSANTVDGESLLYVRSFNHFADAMGHKLFLEQISSKSIKRLIKNNNTNCR